MTETHSLLFEIADRQFGFFTAKQAQEIGFHPNNFTHYVKTGHWIREYRGIYRLAHYPLSHRPDLMLWYLWSCNRKGKPQGVYSYSTALSLYQLTDIMPAKLHMTVPSNFRRMNSIPSILVLHYDDLADEDKQELEGVLVTTPVRTLIDIIRTKNLSNDMIQEGIKQALERGIIISIDEIMTHPLVVQDKNLTSYLNKLTQDEKF